MSRFWFLVFTDSKRSERRVPDACGVPVVYLCCTCVVIAVLYLCCNGVSVQEEIEKMVSSSQQRERDMNDKRRMNVRHS
eukprot:6009935-Pyramimonas_sp.AAC.1